MGEEVSYVHVWSKKEIENYLLHPRALDAAISRQLQARQKRGSLEAIPDFSSEKLIDVVSQEFRNELYGHILEGKMRYLQKSGCGLDLSSVAAQTMERFEKDWSDMESRLGILPGKLFLSALNRHLQESLGISLTPKLISDCMAIELVDSDIIALFDALSTFLSE